MRIGDGGPAAWDAAGGVSNSEGVLTRPEQDGRLGEEGVEDGVEPVGECCSGRLGAGLGGAVEAL